MGDESHREVTKGSKRKYAVEVSRGAVYGVEDFEEFNRYLDKIESAGLSRPEFGELFKFEAWENELGNSSMGMLDELIERGVITEYTKRTPDYSEIDETKLERVSDPMPIVDQVEFPSFESDPWSENNPKKKQSRKSTGKKYTKEEVLDAFREGYGKPGFRDDKKSLYTAARNFGGIDAILNELGMEKQRIGGLPKGYWTKEQVYATCLPFLDENDGVLPSRNVLRDNGLTIVAERIRTFFGGYKKGRELFKERYDKERLAEKSVHDELSTEGQKETKPSLLDVSSVSDKPETVVVNVKRSVVDGDMPTVTLQDDDTFVIDIKGQPSGYNKITTRFGSYEAPASRNVEWTRQMFIDAVEAMVDPATGMISREDRSFWNRFDRNRKKFGFDDRSSLVKAAGYEYDSTKVQTGLRAGSKTKESGYYKNDDNFWRDMIPFIQSDGSLASHGDIENAAKDPDNSLKAGFIGAIKRRGGIKVVNEDGYSRFLSGEFSEYNITPSENPPSFDEVWSSREERINRSYSNPKLPAKKHRAIATSVDQGSVVDGSQEIQVPPVKQRKKLGTDGFDRVRMIAKPLKMMERPKKSSMPSVDGGGKRPKRKETIEEPVLYDGPRYSYTVTDRGRFNSLLATAFGSIGSAPRFSKNFTHIQWYNRTNQYAISEEFIESLVSSGVVKRFNSELDKTTHDLGEMASLDDPESVVKHDSDDKPAVDRNVYKERIELPDEVFLRNRSLEASMTYKVLVDKHSKMLDSDKSSYDGITIQGILSNYSDMGESFDKTDNTLKDRLNTLIEKNLAGKHMSKDNVLYYPLPPEEDAILTSDEIEHFTDRIEVISSPDGDARINALFGVAIDIHNDRVKENESLFISGKEIIDYYIDKFSDDPDLRLSQSNIRPKLKYLSNRNFLKKILLSDPLYVFPEPDGKITRKKVSRIIEDGVAPKSLSGTSKSAKASSNDASTVVDHPLDIEQEVSDSEIRYVIQNKNRFDSILEGTHNKLIKLDFGNSFSDDDWEEKVGKKYKKSDKLLNHLLNQEIIKDKRTM